MVTMIIIHKGLRLRLKIQGRSMAEVMAEFRAWCPFGRSSEIFEDGRAQ